MTGTITRLMEKKPFGFIRANGTSYFFHREDFLGSWKRLVDDFEELGPTIEVTFQPVESTKGPRAAEVKRGTNGHDRNDSRN